MQIHFGSCRHVRLSVTALECRAIKKKQRFTAGTNMQSVSSVHTRALQNIVPLLLFFLHLSFFPLTFNEIQPEQHHDTRQCLLSLLRLRLLAGCTSPLLMCCQSSLGQCATGAPFPWNEMMFPLQRHHVVFFFLWFSCRCEKKGTIIPAFRWWCGTHTENMSHRVMPDFGG